MLFLHTIMPAPLIIATSIISWRAGQMPWLCADFLGTMTVGISLLLTPRWLLGYQTDVRLDPVSPYIARVIGLLLLSSSMHSHRAFSVRHKQECASLSVSRSVTAIMLLMATTYANNHYREWNFRFAQLSIVGAVCWLLPHFCYSLTTISTASPEPRGVVAFLSIDYFMTASLGLAWFAFPQWLLRILTTVQPNGVSVTLARVLGSLLVGLGLESYAATNYAKLSTKKLVHLSRLVICGPMFVLILSASSGGKAFKQTHLVLGIAAVCIWVCNSALGYAVVACMQLANDKRPRNRKQIGSHNEVGSVNFSILCNKTQSLR